MQMQLSSDAQIPDGLLAAMTLLNEKPRLGLGTSRNTLHPGFTATQSTTALRDSWSVASGTRWVSLSCEFGACGSGFQNPVAVGAGAAVCIEAEPCGAIGGLILGAGLIYQIYKGTHSQPTIEGSSRQEQRLLDFVAKTFCVDRKALGDAIHREKIGRPKGKGSDLTLNEIKDLARYLPKIPGCTPTAF
jgi:hypothetical protein